MNKQEFASLQPIEKLLAVMAMLRDPHHGCPWDLKQSLKTLIPYTLEEAYEVADAIEKEDVVELEDELGDLLFQVVFYAQIAAESGDFAFDDVANAIVDKLVRRHPHVFPRGDVSLFGQAQDLSPDEVVVNWEAIKQTERNAKQLKRGAEAPADFAGLLHDVPGALPALQRSQKLQERAAAAGFDWPKTEPVIDKLHEEVREFEAAFAGQDPEQEAAELGDLLFTIVNLCRHRGQEPEAVLREANLRFEQRFNWVEKNLVDAGKQVNESTLEELDTLWNQAKRNGL